MSGSKVLLFRRLLLQSWGSLHSPADTCFPAPVWTRTTKYFRPSNESPLSSRLVGGGGGGGALFSISG
jgi:hypothetical protein